MQTNNSEKVQLVILGTSLLGPEVLDLIEDAGGFQVTAEVVITIKVVMAWR